MGCEVRPGGGSNGGNGAAEQKVRRSSLSEEKPMWLGHGRQQHGLGGGEDGAKKGEQRQISAELKDCRESSGWRVAMAGIGDEVKPRFGNCCGFSEIAGTEKNFESLRWLQEVVSCDREDGIAVLQVGCIF
ncbi:hypothetical protein M0R45_025897 [Rubus argutus]|uniref:Uncharacterized protein n=1 Tax=Rubus argutus TaxID=59490 RepID=A0AAW1WW14_RUBAR